MADITISPIPYNNGTMATTQMQGHYILLNPNMILHVSGQTNPNYIYAWVSTTTGNLKTGTASFTAQPMRAILSFAAAPSSITQLRLYKLTSARALLQVNFEFYVIEVNASNDIVLKNARVGNANGTFVNQQILFATGQALFTGSGGTNAGAGAVGSNLTGWYVRDNVIWFARRMNAGASTAPVPVGTGVELVKLTYNPANDTMSTIAMARLWCPNTTATSINSYVRTYMVSIPNSTKKLVYVRVQNNDSATTPISLGTSLAGLNARNGDVFGNGMSPIVVVDSVTDAVYATNSTNLATLTGPAGAGNVPMVRVIVPHSETSWSVWYNNNQYRMITVSLGTSGTSTGNPITNSNMSFVAAPSNSQFFPSPSSPAVPYHAEALDANYFILFSSSGNTTDGELAVTSPAPTHYIRIGRIVDNDIAQVSSATATSGGLGFTAVTFPVVDQDFLVRYDSETFLMFGRAAAGSTGSAVPVIRVLYQPGG
jgi:hypothetical protein